MKEVQHTPLLLFSNSNRPSFSGGSASTRPLLRWRHGPARKQRRRDGNDPGEDGIVGAQDEQPPQASERSRCYKATEDQPRPLLRVVGNRLCFAHVPIPGKGIK